MRKARISLSSPVVSAVLSVLTISITLFSFQTLAADNNLITAATYQNQNSDDEEFENYKTGNEQEIYDPYEKFNRKVYIFNDAFDRYFLEHIAQTYRQGIPKRARNMIRNFLTNLSLPISALNSFAQGKTDNGLATFSNFLINSTIGLFGLFDVAGNKGILYKSEDLGQTLGRYGVGSGAYLIIPFLGPSSTRDFTGWIASSAINPLGFNVLDVGGKVNLVDADYRIGLAAATAIDMRENVIDIIADIRKDSFDPYATIRSAYLQKRANEIKF